MMRAADDIHASILVSGPLGFVSLLLLSRHILNIANTALSGSTKIDPVSVPPMMSRTSSGSLIWQEMTGYEKIYAVSLHDLTSMMIVSTV